MEHSRDPERSPMQWDDGFNAGFSNGTPWLHVNHNYQLINVEVRVSDVMCNIVTFKIVTCKIEMCKIVTYHNVTCKIEKCKIVTFQIVTCNITTC